MVASTKFPRGEHLHITPQLVLVVLGGLFLTALVVLALLSLAGWL